MAPQRWKVPNSIVAVNHIEIIDHIDWLHNESLFILNRPPVFANYFENYMVVKEIMKGMFSVFFGPKNILGS